jgi:hypothetical protein
MCVAANAVLAAEYCPPKHHVPVLQRCLASSTAAAKQTFAHMHTAACSQVKFCNPSTPSFCVAGGVL